MVIGLKRFQGVGDEHFVTFSCYQVHFISGVKEKDSRVHFSPG
jgi:hypothetical protein